MVRRVHGAGRGIDQLETHAGVVALEELLARIPEFAVDLDGVRWAPGAYVRRPTTVPIAVG